MVGIVPNKSINEKIVNSRIEQKADIINELLAYQVTPPDFNGDISKRKDFWENSFPFNGFYMYRYYIRNLSVNICNECRY